MPKIEKIWFGWWMSGQSKYGRNFEWSCWWVLRPRKKWSILLYYVHHLFSFFRSSRLLNPHALALETQ